MDADLVPNEILVGEDWVPQHQKAGVEAYLDVDRTANGIEGDGIEFMRREFPDDMTEHWQVGPEMGNGGNVLALGERDCDVDEQRTSPAEMVSERRDLFGPVCEHTKSRRKRDRESAYEDPDTVTFVPATERAQAHLVERITILMEADDHLDPDVLTIGGLGDMQNTDGVESPGDQEDVVRGAWEREFRLPPRIEVTGMMSLIGLIVGPISGIHTHIDIGAAVAVAVVRAFRMPTMLAAILSGEVLKEKARPRQQGCPDGALRKSVPRPSGERQARLSQSDGRGSELRTTGAVERRRNDRNDGSDGDSGCAARILCVAAEKNSHIQQRRSRVALRTQGSPSSRQCRGPILGEGEGHSLWIQKRRRR